MSQTPNSSPTPPSDPQAHNAFEDQTPHREADDREEIFFSGSPMLRGNIGRATIFFLIAILLIAAPFLYSAASHKPVVWWAYLVFIALGLLVFLVHLMIVKAITYKITNYRIDFERGILGKRIDTLELWHVEDIQFRQSLIDRILGVGSIMIVSADATTPNLAMHGIPHPRPLFEKLKQRIIAVKRQRGVVKMDIGGIGMGQP